MDYNHWREFEGVIERAIIACQNVGQPATDHFGEAPKMVLPGKGAPKEHQRLSSDSYACYLVAMNGDPHKTAVANAQAYFSLKTREAELAHSAINPNIHKLSDAMKPRALENLHRVPEGYFSVTGELFRHLYYLEAILDEVLDGEAILEESVGLHWSRFAREELEISDQERIGCCQRNGARSLPANAVGTSRDVPFPILRSRCIPLFLCYPHSSGGSPHETSPRMVYTSRQ
jgi:hypothetical protein